MFFILDKESKTILETFNNYTEAWDRLGYWLTMYDCSVYGEIK